MSDSFDSSPSSRPEWFLTTHWSVVLAAGQADSQRQRAALERLCQTYWYPLYAFVRRRVVAKPVTFPGASLSSR